MTLRWLFTAFAAIFLTPNVHAASSPATLATFDNIAIATLSAAPIRSSQVKEAILMAAQRRKWIAQEIAPNAIAATILVRDHQVTVDIVYTDKEFSVKYRDSENLGYRMTSKGPKIHRNYNKWVKTLVLDIKAQILTLR